MIKGLFFIIAFVVFVNFIVQTITGLDVTKLQLAEEVISKYRINFALERAENFFLYVGGFAFAWVIINIGENVVSTMGVNTSWLEQEEKVNQVQVCVAELEAICGKFSARDRSRSIMIHYPDGSVQQVESVKEAARLVGCSKTTVARSLATGGPVLKGSAKGIIFAIRNW
ncbi:hypothetical protein BAU18_003025 [Enterococcus diestrammenae]|uniref:Uncharacterized protein n=1 Tax=Enterococcus diestrammenae TaxID=1155073 RepID=A0ABV0F5T4_9ENTE|nr:hypothetical protein BAU18_13375 [Enterococcus diestrammenae]